MQRTIRLKLNPTVEQAQILHNTLASFTTAFNHVAAYGWQHDEKNTKVLHQATYYPLKAKLTLPAQLICAARVKAGEALKSAFARLKAKRKANQPHSKLCPIRYDARSYWVAWDTETASLATSSGRQLLGFSVPEYAQKYTGYPTASADLIYRKGRFWLHVVVNLPDPEFTDSSTIIGIDLGLNRPAVTSERQFLGKKQWKAVDRKYFRIKRALQSKGTKSAKKHLRKLSGRLKRFRRDCDHVLSKRIVQSATAGTTLVIEHLTNIRSHPKIKQKRATARRLHSWSFAQFRAFLSYKAQEAGMKVVAVDPRYTSQTCSKCGYQHRSNCKAQSLFLCRACHYQLNADLNASYNIKGKHLASLGITSIGAGQSLPVMSQTSV